VLKSASGDRQRKPPPSLQFLGFSGRNNVPSNQASVTLEQARTVIEAAERKASEIGVAMNIAVVDAGNNLTAFARMDGAWLGSIDIAQNKAYTARAFDMATQELATSVRNRGLHPRPSGHLCRRHPACGW
jgi:Haem-degrading